MTRQEQLNEAWCKYRGKCSTEIIQALAFALRWCDEHPHWISVEDDLPPKLKNKQYTDYYIVYSTRGVQKMRYNYDRMDWQDESGMMYIAKWGVTHWMLLPTPPKTK